MKLGKYITAFGVFLVVMLSACLSPIEEVVFKDEERPRFAVPLLETSFTLGDALGDFNFRNTLLDSSGLRLQRRDTVVDIFPIYSIVLPGITAPLADSITEVSLADVGVSVPVSKIEFQAGRLEYALASNDAEELSVELKLPNFTLAGDTLTITETIPPSGTVSSFVDLEDYFFELDSDEIIYANYTARTPSGAPKLLQFAVIQLDQYVPRTAIGSLDSQTVSLGLGTVVTDFFAEFEPNSASLENASVNFDITNETEAPFDVVAIRSFANLRDGSEFNFSTPIDNGISVQPRLGADLPYEFSLEINEGNSTLVEAVRQFPDSLTFDLVGVTNPDRLDQDFTIDWQEKIFAQFVFDVPLNVKFDGFAVNQGFSFGEIDDFDQLENLELLLSTTNSFGLSAEVQIYLQDTSGLVVDSLFNSPTLVLQAGQLNDQGETIIPSTYNAVIPLSDTQFDQIQANPSAEARVFLNTPEGDEVFAKLDNSNALSLRVGLSFQYHPE